MMPGKIWLLRQGLSATPVCFGDLSEFQKSKAKFAERVEARSVIGPNMS
jgi:hypothetical protein